MTISSLVERASLLKTPPRTLWVSQATHGGLADDTVDLMAGLRRPLDDWQELEVRAILGQTDEQIWHAAAEMQQRRFAAQQCGCWVPRQNGKGDILMAVTIAWLFFLREPLVIHSAHEYKTAAEAYLRLRNFCERHDTLNRRVHNFYRGAGEQGIVLTRRYGSGRLRYLARTGSSGRGFSAGKIILDEAQELSLDEIKAILFVVSAQPNWQIVFAGTPPSDPAAWIYELKELGESGDPEVAWADWGMDWIDPNNPRFAEVVADEATWAATNPGYPHRIEPSTVRKELRLLKASVAFAQERCGLWLPRAKDATEVHPIDLDKWALSAATPAKPNKVAIAFHVSNMRTHATIGYAGMIAGRWRVGIIRHQIGTHWVIPALQDLAARAKPLAFVTDSKAESLVGDLAEVGIRVSEAATEPKRGDLLLPTASDVAASFAMVVDAVNNDMLRHHDEPPLNSAVAVKPRPLVGGQTWDHRTGTEVGPAKVIAEAMWAYRRMTTMPEAPTYDAAANIW